MLCLSLASFFWSCARAVFGKSSTHAWGDLSSICQGVSQEPTSEYLSADVTFCWYSRSNSSLRFQSRLPLEQLPRFFLLVLEPLFLLRARSPAVSLSPKVLKLHVLELGSHRGFVLVSCFDEEAQRLVGQGGYFLSSRGWPWLSSAEPSGVAVEALTYWKRTVVDKRDEVRRRPACRGSLEGGCTSRRLPPPTLLPVLPSTLLLV